MTKRGVMTKRTLSRGQTKFSNRKSLHLKNYTAVALTSVLRSSQLHRASVTAVGEMSDAPIHPPPSRSFLPAKSWQHFVAGGLAPFSCRHMLTCTNLR